MTAARRQVELLEKNRPQQERAKRTYESILDAAAELLVEVGVERISTNLIAERAGITVPALYRYFPNKYSVINAMGAVLMDRQNQVFQDWFDAHASAGDLNVFMAHIYELLWGTYQVTLAQKGGLEISQSLRAVGPLQELRLTSHTLVSEQLALLLAEMTGVPVDEGLRTPARVTIETGYSLVEMALESPADEVEGVLRSGADMIRSYWQSLLQMQGG